MKKLLCLLLFACSLQAAESLVELFQSGVAAEEANHDLVKAEQVYQQVIARMEEERKIGASALFRLGETYRKRGMTNEAQKTFERLAREYPEQTLWRDSTALAAPVESPALTAAKERVLDLSTTLAALRGMRGEQQSLFFQVQEGDVTLQKLVQDLNKSEQDHVRALSDYGPKHPDSQKAEAICLKIRQQIRERTEEMITGLETSLRLAETKIKALEQQSRATESLQAGAQKGAGEVRFSGQVKQTRLALAAGQTLLLSQALKMVGVSEYANLKRVTVRRFNPATQETKTFVLDMKKQDLPKEQDFALQAGDHVTVPEKGISF